MRQSAEGTDQKAGQGQRIDSIDGWRAVASLGVLYTHAWATLQFPSLMIGGVDLMQVLNLWGNGVHLFYVISGLCFFLVLRRQPTQDLKAALGFLKKRWLRIAPAFYVAAAAYGIYYFHADLPALLCRLALNFAFLQTYFVPGAEISSIFWSLNVEWHFYLLLPLIFWCIRKWRLVPVMIVLLLLEIAASLLHYKGLLLPGDLWWYSIASNLQYFCIGILAGYLYKEAKQVPGILRSGWALLVGLAVAYAGKIMFTSAFVTKAGAAGFIFQSLGPLVMTMGFALMILVSLFNKFAFRLLSNPVFIFLGRISFSFYLWHELVLELVHRYCNNWLPHTALGVFWYMLLVALVLIPLSMLSYRFLESFYFKRKTA